jgi:GNAT superfamily N-acetyltransferase
MCRKQVEVVAPVFTKHESFRLKARNGNGELTIHKVIDPFDVLMQPSDVCYNLRVAITALVISILASFHYPRSARFGSISAVHWTLGKLMKRVMRSIDIRYTDKFPEPEFSSIQRLVFSDIQQSSSELESVLLSEKTGADLASKEMSPIFRLGAYDGEKLVGWTYGWLERNNVFYMANSGVLPTHRRRGIYTSLLNAIREHALMQGASCICSRHSVINNPVIIAKLRAGFNVSGLSNSAQMGTLVELTLHLSNARQAMFQKRVLPYVTGG